MFALQAFQLQLQLKLMKLFRYSYS